MNQTKIKGDCQSGRKVVTHNSKSDLPLGWQTGIDIHNDDWCCNIWDFICKYNIVRCRNRRFMLLYSSWNFKMGFQHMAGRLAAETKYELDIIFQSYKVIQLTFQIYVSMYRTFTFKDFRLSLLSMRLYYFYFGWKSSWRNQILSLLTRKMMFQNLRLDWDDSRLRLFP